MSTVQHAAERQVPASSRQSSKNAAWRNTVSMKSGTHEISHPDSLSGIQVFISESQSATLKGGEQIRGESQWEEEASETNGVLRTSSSCVLLMVVSCLLHISVCLACGDGWARPRQSADTPLMSHSSLANRLAQQHGRVMDGLRLSYTQHTPIYHKRKLTQDRTHIVTQIHLLLKSFSCLNFQTAGSHYLCFFFPFMISFFFCLWSLLEDAFCICSHIIWGWQWNKRQAREGETSVREFFFPRSTSIQIKSYYLPLALWHCGIEWSMEEARLQQRAHCRLIRAFWAGRPPLPAPREAPHTTAPQGQWGPQLRAVANVLNGLGGSFLRGREDAKGIISFQHGGKGRKWQPLTRLLTQSKEKVFNCCERC